MDSNSEASLVLESLPGRRRGKGIPLIEVFNMIYLGHDLVKPSEQHGTIKLTSSKGVQYLYDIAERDVDLSNPSIKHGDDLVVTVKGPTCYIPDEYFQLQFDLFSGAFNDTTDIIWHGADLYDGTEVDLKERRIRSTDGTREISVLLGLFPSAAVANLEIKLLDNFAGLDVYGVVVASNSKSDQSKCTSVLFAKKASRKIKLGTDGVIPLSKFRVAVPLNSVLFVDMSLHVNGKHYKASYSLNAKHFGDSDARPLKAKNFGDSDAEECDARPMFQVSAKWDANIESVYSEYDYQYSRPSSIYSEYDYQYSRPSSICVFRTNPNMTTEAETMVVYRSCDCYDFKVSEEVVFRSQLMKDVYLKDKKNEPEKKKHIYRIPGVTRDNLAMVINCCNNHIALRDIFLLPLVPLFNLIQAAHFLHIQVLMDSSCRILVIKNRQIRKQGVTYLLENQQHSEYDCNLKIDILLRSRLKDTFINDSDFSQVYISPFVLSQLRFVKRGKEDFKEHFCKIVKLKHLPELLKAIRSFEELIHGDPRLAYCISAGVVRYFINILNRTRYNPDNRLDIQRPILSILSRARYDVCGDVIEHELLPRLVGLVSDPINGLAISAVIALTHIAYTFPDRIKVIVDKGALEAARTALDNHSAVYWSMEHLAKFLATVCRGYSSSFDDDLSFDKVGKILTMLDIVCQKWSYEYRMVHTVTCYALLYLSYNRRVSFEDEVWNRLRQRLVDYISIANDPGRGCRLGIKGKVVKNVNLDQMLAGSALGVVGHIMRWGNQDQMQSLTEVPRFWGCLLSMLHSKLKKFQMEACQIISNVAARRTRLDVVEANLEEHICGLLGKGGSDVKMEAAWAIFNIICGRVRLFSMSDMAAKGQKALAVVNSIRYDDIDEYHEKAEY